MDIMIRWLSRYVKRIDLHGAGIGVGIELRELPESQPLALPESESQTADSTLTPTSPESVLPPIPADHDEGVIELVRYLRVAGVSASTQRKPRELDLTIHGDEIEFHIHDPSKIRPKLWVTRTDFQEAMNNWQASGNAEPMRVRARKARSKSEVVFVIDNDDEVEVQAHWWIWVSRNELKAALNEIGIHTPW